MSFISSDNPRHDENRRERNNWREYENRTIHKEALRQKKDYLIGSRIEQPVILSGEENLVEYGFRLPSAFDNRPLNFEEFYSHINQAIFVSATPGEFEKGKSAQIAEQVIRPTGLLDPEIFVRSTDGQIDDLISEINMLL